MKLVLAVDSIRFPLTGVGRYAYELAKQLQISPEITDLRYFYGRRFVEELPVAEGSQSHGAHKLKQRAQQSLLITEIYRVLMPMLKARALRGFDEFIFHSPNYYLPPFEGRSVATFHDLSVFTWADYHPAERVRFMQKELKKTLRYASALITDSQFNRRELAEYFSFPIERVHAVPLASGPEFHPRDAVELHGSLARYGLQPGGYALFVGTLEPRKNIETLLDAYGRLPLGIRQQWPLVFSGYHGWRSEGIHARIAAAEQEGWARYLGFTTGEDLPLLFSGARMFAFPSLYEGFGLPVLEAMASGVPVVCSNSSSLPEVAGDAAAMCDPLDVDAIGELIERALVDDAWRSAAREKGLARASMFSWKKCAESTIDVYKTL